MSGEKTDASPERSAVMSEQLAGWACDYPRDYTIDNEIHGCFNRARFKLQALKSENSAPKTRPATTVSPSPASGPALSSWGHAYPFLIMDALSYTFLHAITTTRLGPA